MDTKPIHALRQNDYATTAVNRVTYLPLAQALSQMRWLLTQKKVDIFKVRYPHSPSGIMLTSLSKPILMHRNAMYGFLTSSLHNLRA